MPSPSDLCHDVFYVSDKEVSVADASLMTKVLRTHLTNVKSEVEVLQRDPNSPLYSAKTFEELNLYVILYDFVVLIQEVN